MAEENKSVAVPSQQEKPLCLKCLHPVSSGVYYCEQCGEAVGQLTPYIPFVNIRFNYSVFGIMWKRIWRDKETHWVAKIFYGLLIVLFVPWLLLCFPFELFRRRQSVDGD